MPNEGLARDVLTIAAAIVLVALLFVVVAWIVRRVAGVFLGGAKDRGVARAAKALGQTLRLVWTLVGLVVVLTIAGGGAYLIWRDIDVLGWTVDALTAVDPAIWQALTVGLVSVGGVGVLLFLLLGAVRRALGYASTRVQAMDRIAANDDAVAAFFASLERIAGRVAWLVFLCAACALLGLPVGLQEAAFALLWVYLIIAAGMLLMSAFGVLLDSLDALSLRFSSRSNLLGYYEQLRHLLPLLRRAVEYALFVSIATLVAMQIEPLAALANWWEPVISVIGIVLLSRIAVEVLNLVIDEYMVRRANLDDSTRQRRLTLTPIVKSLLKYAVYFLAIIMVLQKLEIDPTPILAGAGLAGLAIALAARDLISDFVTGFFILFEDYFLVGDYVRIAEAEGFVETIDLRATRIRDNDGRLHILRNGTIATVVNYSKEYTYAVVTVGVAYESDLDAVTAALEEVGRRLDETVGDVLEPTVVQGLEVFAESELIYRTITKVRPGKHKLVERAARRLLKEVFDERGIEIPYARRVLIWGDGERPEGLGGGEPVPPPAGGADGD